MIEKIYPSTIDDSECYKRIKPGYYLYEDNNDSWHGVVVRTSINFMDYVYPDLLRNTVVNTARGAWRQYDPSLYATPIEKGSLEEQIDYLKDIIRSKENEGNVPF